MCSFCNFMSNLILNSFSKMSNGDKVSEVKNNAYGLSLIISLNDRLGSKQYIFSFLTWSSFFFF